MVGNKATRDGRSPVREFLRLFKYEEVTIGKEQKVVRKRRNWRIQLGSTEKFTNTV